MADDNERAREALVVGNEGGGGGGDGGGGGEGDGNNKVSTPQGQAQPPSLSVNTHVHKRNLSQNSNSAIAVADASFSSSSAVATAADDSETNNPPNENDTDSGSIFRFGPEPIPISPSEEGDSQSPTATSADIDHDYEDDLETPKASMFLPKSARQGGGTSTPRPGISRVGSELSIKDDYFPNPLASVLPSTSERGVTRGGGGGAGGGRGGTGGLSSQATTAISLPEGVLSHQQQAPNMDRVTSSRGTSITGAPSFSSDAGSLASFVPTLDGRGNDIEGMLGEILSMDDGGVRWWGIESSAASGINSSFDEMDLGGGSGAYDIEEEESSDEERDKGMSDEARISRWRGRKKHFFILSGAGKPVYSRHGNGSGTEQMLVSGYMGVIQTIVSFFQDSGEPPGDSLRSFTAGKHRFVVVKEEGPLYLVAVSSLPCESDTQLRAQLDKLYSQVVATLTVSALTRVFSQREGYDLRRLLGGTEVFLDGLSDAMTRGDPGTLLSALECVRLRKRDREKIHGCLLKARNDKLLYGMVVADGRLVGVVRPRRHSLHPMDLQVVFGMLFNAGTFREATSTGTVGDNDGAPESEGGSGAGEHWTPICLPKFNSRGYLYAYIHFWRRELAIVLLSADHSAFYELREIKKAVIQKLDAPDPSLRPAPPLIAPSSGGSATSSSAASVKSATTFSLTGIIESALSANRYSVDEVLRPIPTAPKPFVRIPRVLHFLYKSKRNVQFTMPSYEPNFSTLRARRRLMSIYQSLHSKVHKSNSAGGGSGGGGQGGLKVHYERVGGWVVVAWVETTLEVYVVAQPGGGGSSARGWDGLGDQDRKGLAEVAGRIVRWVGKEEERCFVVGGAVF